jgi:hypothetical protein
MKRTIPFAALVWVALGAFAAAQDGSATGHLGFAAVDSLSASPSRAQLVLAPGREKTVVVNVSYNAPAPDALPSRLAAYLGDWTMGEDGSVRFDQPGTRPDSAANWITYSPGEMTLAPGETRPVRVTVAVPATAAPGEYLACLFVEPRPEAVRQQRPASAVQVRYRLAASFYVSVTGATRKGVLDRVTVTATSGALTIVPRMHNEGTAHVRPTFSVKVFDRGGQPVAELADAQGTPVLGGRTLERAIVVQNALAAGEYVVRYRVDFGDGGAVSETRVPLVITSATAGAAAEGSTTRAGRDEAPASRR